ncbi:GNAT family N-acetyltransferase [Pseudoduganella sp.]|uniref:GNAT family N-acetyltransferase n=1 Tax=Pseudoduganella sp. TaxID=1880898 RepID=UPI0035AF2BDC
MSERGALALRSETAADRAFLRALFGAVRGPELGLGGLDAATLDTLLDLQFAAQQQSFRHGYPQARFEVIEVGGAAVGRMVVAQHAGAFLLLDIALLPEWRGRGIGGGLLRGLQQQAAAARQPLRLNVVLNNPAEALYRRLGFKETGVSGMHRAMEWENTMGEQQ